MRRLFEFLWENRVIVFGAVLLWMLSQSLLASYEANQRYEALAEWERLP